MHPEAVRPGPLALVGSGEYLPVMAGVEGTLIEGRPPRYVRATAGSPPGTTVIGIDEDTAIVDLAGEGRHWQVHGRQWAWVLDGGRRRPFPAGAELSTPLSPR
jgi:hypothetical protein